MSSLSDEDADNDGNYMDELKELYGIRDGILFVIDATPPMFQNDPLEGIPYFLQCIRQYKDILKQKLVWDRQDWMGLILFGTKVSDGETETNGILTLQKLSPVSKAHLEQAMKIDEGKKWEDYRDIASTTAYPLHDVLWHAARAFSAIDVTMPLRKVILFTCQDNPPMTSDSEKHRIRVKATSYSDIGLQLSVVGLGNCWNHDLFYKDLEILSEKIDADDYKRTSLKDLVEQVKLPSRSMAKLPWRLGEGVDVDVSLCNLSVKTQYLNKQNMSKQANVPLYTSTHLQIADDDNTEERETEESERIPSPVLEMDVDKYQTYGGKDIYFSLAEVRGLNTIREPGIDVICMKPIFYHPMYHFGTPYFVVPSKSNRQDNKLLFAALLDKCDARNLMVVCAVTVRKHSAPGLYAMIPNAKRGGFYLYRTPFRDDVRKIDDNSPDYVYYNNERKPPTDPNGIELLKSMIKKLTVEYNSNLFPNPKLQAELQTLEIVALDLEKREPPPDRTLPNEDEMRALVKDLLQDYNEIFDEEPGRESDSQSKKKAKKANEATSTDAFESEANIKDLVKQEKIERCTIPQLKCALKTLGLKTSGKKEELISRIKGHYK